MQEYTHIHTHTVLQVYKLCVEDVCRNTHTCTHTHTVLQAKKQQPIIMTMQARARSCAVNAEISPYPIVVIVVIAQYTLKMGHSSQVSTSYGGTGHLVSSLGVRGVSFLKH